MPVLDGSAAQRDGQVGLADAGRAEQDDVLAVGDEATRRELLNEPLVERRLEREVEIVERLDRGEVRNLHAHGDALAVLGVHLVAQELVEEVEVRGLLVGGLAEERVEPLGEMAQAQLLEMLDDACVYEVSHGHLRR